MVRRCLVIVSDLYKIHELRTVTHIEVRDWMLIQRKKARLANL